MVSWVIRRYRSGDRLKRVNNRLKTKWRDLFHERRLGDHENINSKDWLVKDEPRRTCRPTVSVLQLDPLPSEGKETEISGGDGRIRLLRTGTKWLSTYDLSYTNGYWTINGSNYLLNQEWSDPERWREPTNQRDRNHFETRSVEKRIIGK